MSNSKDKEDTFIAKLGKLEEAGKQRERTGLEELLVESDNEVDEELPVAAGDDAVFMSGFDEKLTKIRSILRKKSPEGFHLTIRYVCIFGKLAAFLCSRRIKRSSWREKLRQGDRKAPSPSVG